METLKNKELIGKEIYIVSPHYPEVTTQLLGVGNRVEGFHIVCSNGARIRRMSSGQRIMIDNIMYRRDNNNTGFIVA